MKFLQKMFTIAAISLLVVPAVFANGNTEAKTVTKKEMKMGLISGEGDPLTDACRKFASIVKEKTDGNLTISIIPSGAIGGEIEMQDMMSQGALDMTSFGNAIPINYNPQYQLLSMPFLWENSEQMLAFAESDIQEEMNENYRKASGIRVLASNWDMGARNLIATRPIQKVEDFKGLKIRVPQVPAWIDVWELLGCNVVSTSWGELYPALQQGVADAAEVPWFWVKTGSLQEIAKNATPTGHIRYFNQIMINDELFSSFSPEYQQILIDAAHEAGEYETKLTQDNEAQLVEDLKADGVTFYSINIADVQKATAPVYEKWEETYGADLLKRVNDFKANN